MTETFTPIHRGHQAIQSAFNRRNQSGGKVLIPYAMAGDPDLGTTEKIVRSLSSVGADIIELGMPFSDPIADGPVIQRAGQRSLRQHVTLKKLLDMVTQIRLDINTPIIIMTYYNLFLKYGFDSFAQDAAKAGIDGLIVPDIPYEESGSLREALAKEGLALITLLAPTSTDERIQSMTDSKGFIYYVSRTGVTGIQKDIAPDLKKNVARIRSMIDLPVAVGFGVSEPQQAVDIAKHADGVVIGSALVRLIEETNQLHERVVAKHLKPFIDLLHGSD